MRMVYFDSIYNQCTVDTVSYSTLVYSCSSQHFLPPLALSRTPRLRSRFIPSAFKPPSVALVAHTRHTHTNRSQYWCVTRQCISYRPYYLCDQCEVVMY